MSEKVQEAIVATRAGQKREAQFLLAEALQENPNDEYAWFLLGNLVDSPEKRMAYLNKALAINPHNEKARQQLTHIQRQAMAEAEAEPVVVMVKEDEATAVIEDLDALPEWLSEQVEDEEESEAVEEAMAIAEENFEGVKEVKSKPTAVSTPPKTAVKSDHGQQIKQYNQILLILGILIVIVIIALIWTL
jgi:tetratricopeptide (TPR) repeat protein